MRLLVFWLCAGVPALAQFADLATTSDGSEVYFTTTLRQREAGQTHDPKLFRLRDSALSLLSTQACDVIRMTGACGISEVQVSGDGSVVAWQSLLPCTGGSTCAFRELGFATLLTQDGRRTFAGRIRMSRNGRFVVLHSTPGSGAPGVTEISRLHDLATGAVTEMVPSIRSYGSAVKVADNGTILMSSGVLLTPLTRTQAPLIQQTFAVDMDAQAHVVLSRTDNRRRLYITDVAASRTWQLGPDDRDSYGGSISADGRWVLYVSVIGNVPQLFFSRIDGSDWRQLTLADDGVQDSALSYDGRVAFAVTGRGSLIRIDTSSGSSQEMIGPTPRDLRLSGASALGSLSVLTGAGLAPGNAVASPALTEELADTRVNINGIAMLLYSVSPTQILFQIPWEAPVVRDTSLVLSTGNEFFETSIPAYIRSAVDIHATVHENFQTLVTFESPASAGEIIHVYATGLGPVTPPVVSGMPTPDGELSVVTTPWGFTWSEGSPGFGVVQSAEVPADVLFVGLAPGMFGVYQIDVRAPSSTARGLNLQIRRPDGALLAFERIPLRL